MLLLPFMLLLGHSLQLPGPLHLFGQVLGGVALLVVPGYVLLWALRLDPLATSAPGYRWPLVVPLSLSLDILLGTLLVITPIGLSARSLWAGLSVLVLGSAVVGWRR
jgi:hypothetical protein